MSSDIFRAVTLFLWLLQVFSVAYGVFLLSRLQKNQISVNEVMKAYLERSQQVLDELKKLEAQHKPWGGEERRKIDNS